MRTFEPGRCLELISDPALGLTHFFGVPANYLFMPTPSGPPCA
jgi:fatty-acyl-CoA synthase